MEPKDRIIVALDTNDTDRLRDLVRQLSPHVGMFKIGLNLITAMGVERAVSIVRTYQESDAGIFLDGKFDDIPETVAAASRNVVARGVDVFNVHASAGPDSVRAAVLNRGAAKVLAVTVLTSIGDDVSQRIFGRQARDAVVDLATEAILAGADGIICSAQELAYLTDFGCLKFTPGIRPLGASDDDQKRVSTPAAAIRNRATRIIVGRPIIDAASPVDAARRIADEIAAA